MAMDVDIQIGIQTARDGMRTVGILHPDLRYSFIHRMLVQIEIHLPQRIPGQIELACRR
jgi:hypothetical protein